MSMQNEYETDRALSLAVDLIDRLESALKTRVRVYWRGDRFAIRRLGCPAPGGIPPAEGDYRGRHEWRSNPNPVEWVV